MTRHVEDSGGGRCRTEEQQAVGPVEEPVAEVSAAQHSVGTGQLR